MPLSDELTDMLERRIFGAFDSLKFLQKKEVFSCKELLHEVNRVYMSKSTYSESEVRARINLLVQERLLEREGQFDRYFLTARGKAMQASVLVKVYELYDTYKQLTKADFPPGTPEFVITNANIVEQKMAFVKHHGCLRPPKHEA